MDLLYFDQEELVPKGVTIYNILKISELIARSTDYFIQQFLSGVV